MAAHVLAPPLHLSVPAARSRIALAALVLFVLGMAGVGLALALPGGQSGVPAQFQGEIAAH